LLKFCYSHTCGYDQQGGKSSSRIRHDDMSQAAHTDSPLSHLPLQTTEGDSSLSGQASEYEETESGRAH
jgi:calmodulin-binding transcription activator